MEPKKLATTLAIIVGLSGAAGVNTDIGKKTLACTGKQVKMEYQDNYYCASRAEYSKDLSDFKIRLTQNKLEGKADLALGQLIVKNDAVAIDEIVQIFVNKYDLNTKEFDGTKFDSDIIDQSFLVIEVANKKCGSGCSLTGDTMTEKIYNLISSK